ncbi:hypothetical protein LTR08_005391 [Meristemomyces frigidus]|nr:hypothetical protein LTR08_005391 [Meristemomyces frigidus]
MADQPSKEVPGTDEEYTSSEEELSESNGPHPSRTAQRATSGQPNDELLAVHILAATRAMVAQDKASVPPSTPSDATPSPPTANTQPSQTGAAEGAVTQVLRDQAAFIVLQRYRVLRRTEGQDHPDWRPFDGEAQGYIDGDNDAFIQAFMAQATAEEVRRAQMQNFLPAALEILTRELRLLPSNFPEQRAKKPIRFATTPPRSLSSPVLPRLVWGDDTSALLQRNANVLLRLHPNDVDTTVQEYVYNAPHNWRVAAAELQRIEAQRSLHYRRWMYHDGTTGTVLVRRSESGGLIMHEFSGGPPSGFWQQRQPESRGRITGHEGWNVAPVGNPQAMQQPPAAYPPPPPQQQQPQQPQ